MIARKILLWAIVIIALALLTESAYAGQNTGVLRANAQNEIVLDRPAIVGSTVLPAGRYFVHSHGKGAKQEVHFMQEETLSTVHPETSAVTVYNEVGRVDCDAQASASAEKVTVLNYVEENGMLRIVSAEIQGETHLHVF